MSIADRAAKFKTARISEGLTQMNVWVPADALPELKAAIALLCADRDLRVARLMNVRTGRLRGLG